MEQCLMIPFIFLLVRLLQVDIVLLVCVFLTVLRCVIENWDSCALFVRLSVVVCDLGLEARKWVSNGAL